MARPRRVLLKLSGEALAGEKKTGFDEATVKAVAAQVKRSVTAGVQIAIVIGGGNFWRGRSSNAIDRVKADQIGMLATVMNCLYVSEIFRSEGMDTEVFTAFPVGTMTTPFSKDAANAALAAGKVVFFGGGTGHPYFSTDTGVALRAIEMEADEILLAKAVDGIYDSDPKLNPNAVKYDTISLSDIVEQRLGVMDLAAAILCLENHMPMAVFGLEGENAISEALMGNITGTRVTVE
ncbi:MAG: UMP kinase [Lachnospiraceae bacterium]|nr:UMP kinase [Lachnospiraceae bacterium]